MFGRKAASAIAAASAASFFWRLTAFGRANLKTAFGEIDRQNINVRHRVLLVCAITAHRGSLRRRPEGASTPSVRKWRMRRATLAKDKNLAMRRRSVET
jgi:hypothetical protein